MDLAPGNWRGAGRLRSPVFAYRGNLEPFIRRRFAGPDLWTRVAGGALFLFPFIDRHSPAGILPLEKMERILLEEAIAALEN